VSERTAGTLNCTVAWAAPGFQFCIELQLPAGSTVSDACAAARARLLADRVAGAASVPWDGADCGIFGQPCHAERPLQEGDRVELYRPLQVNPRDSRRNRAESARRARGAR
jgi:putative ubiquitin-RnfH superfamily antitoxin RatB of RatAB toxin-antitoxin module